MSDTKLLSYGKKITKLRKQFETKADLAQPIEVKLSKKDEGTFAKAVEKVSKRSKSSG